MKALKYGELLLDLFALLDEGRLTKEAYLSKGLEAWSCADDVDAAHESLFQVAPNAEWYDELTILATHRVAPTLQESFAA